MKTFLCIIVRTNQPNTRSLQQQSTQAQEKKSDFAFYLFDMRERLRRDVQLERGSRLISFCIVKRSWCILAIQAQWVSIFIVYSYANFLDWQSVLDQIGYISGSLHNLLWRVWNYGKKIWSFLYKNLLFHRGKQDPKWSSGVPYCSLLLIWWKDRKLSKKNNEIVSLCSNPQDKEHFCLPNTKTG